MASIELGNNWTLKEDSNGNFIAVSPNGTEVTLKQDGTIDAHGNDIQNAGSVSADSLNIKNTAANISDASSHLDGNSVAVGTSATEIWNFDYSDSAMLVVEGREQGGADSSQFVDVITANYYGSTAVINKNGRSRAATRTYGMNGSSVELTMGSGTYNIAVSLINIHTTS